ncbi:MAG: hypothetical protein A2V98_09470 [Planctomycetes bacterium RBG_16_64_12]|nr:MAG: hypothetical protein A2V98_09470 [Planctomycetes bacterium RBG_16_64_12]
MRRLTTLFAILWAAPWTLFGLYVGGIGLVTGGRVQRTGRVIEFWGGFVAVFLRVFPLIAGASAVTFGHTVLARGRAQLDACRKHELVHVRQYERWGPLFVPAYLLFWLRLWLSGKNPYYDNPFERQAFDETG